MILDVGSGHLSKYHIPIKHRDTIHVDIRRDAFHVEVICDAQRLPFRDKAFTFVHASHILEHLEYPLQALEEFKRVTQRMVVVKVPNLRFVQKTTGWDSRGMHLHTWSNDSLQTICERVFPSVEVHRRDRLQRKVGPLRHIYHLLLVTLMNELPQLEARCYCYEA
jgi:ubiquinone/menaquinone biosynthesis C-methylase UbiE